MTSPIEQPLPEQRVKHLEMIQAVIARLGNGSFLIKGWTMTLAGLFLGFAAKESSGKIAATTLLPVIGFWLLDGYYLRQERLFRHLYEDARQLNTRVEMFSMNVAPYRPAYKWKDVVLSHTLVNFYGVLSLADSTATIWLIID